MTIIKHYLGWLTIVLLMVLAEIPALQLKGVFYFDRTLIEAGEVWRLLTTHLVHLNLTHFGMNLLGLGIIAWVAPRWLVDWRALFTALWLFLVVGYGLYSLPVMQYFGFSGVLYGWLVLALGFAPHYQVGMRLLAVGFVSAKVLLEQIPGFSFIATDAAIGAPVLVEAHFFGLLGGALAAPVLWRWFAKSGRAAPQ